MLETHILNTYMAGRSECDINDALKKAATYNMRQP